MQTKALPYDGVCVSSVQFTVQCHFGRKLIAAGLWNHSNHSRNLKTDENVVVHLLSLIFYFMCEGLWKAVNVGVHCLVLF